MPSDEMTWQEAVRFILEDSDQPLHYQRITEMIGDRGLRALSGATPSATVRACLFSMVDPGNSSYDDRIRRVTRGVYEFFSTEDGQQAEEQEVKDVEEEEKTQDTIGVPAFGLHWEKDKVKWKKPGEILGRQMRDADAVNFSDQQGVYVLHKDRSVVYIGKTNDSLFERLYSHNKSRKALRWDRFSWFGFRKVDEKGELNEPRDDFNLKHVVSILEAVLIESLEPPVNGQRGEFMGDLYEQVPNSEIAQRQSREFLQNLVG